MRTDTSFSDRKLSPEEFADKYWTPRKGRVFPYQYHDGRIEDGRDEREQFVFNNIRALYDMIRELRQSGCRNSADLLELEVDRKWSQVMKEIQALRDEVQSLKEITGAREPERKGWRRILKRFLGSG